MKKKVASNGRSFAGRSLSTFPCYDCHSDRTDFHSDTRSDVETRRVNHRRSPPGRIYSRLGNWVELVEIRLKSNSQVRNFCKRRKRDYMTGRCSTLAARWTVAMRRYKLGRESVNRGGEKIVARDSLRSLSTPTMLGAMSIWWTVAQRIAIENATSRST